MNNRDDLEAFTARIEKMIADQFREFRMTQARLLRESAELVDGPRKELFLRMADEWEKAAHAE